MRTLVLVSCTMLMRVALAEEHPFDYTFQRDINGHHIEVVLKLRSFNPKQHHLERKNDIAYIDGAIPIGTDNTFSAFTEFSQFEVRWDGHLVEISKSYYSDLYNPSLFPKTNPAFDTHGSIWTAVSNNGEAVLIEFEGSEAAGAYKVWLVIRKDGKHQRFVENTTP
jgi:hypothetical protein